MLRHRLAALFQPRSLLIISSRKLSVVDMPPNMLRGRIYDVRVKPNEDLNIPKKIDFLSDGQRLDLVLICVNPALLPKVLNKVSSHKPRAIILLPHEIPAKDPDQVRNMAQTWGRQNNCLVLGPGAFGIQRPYTGLNLGLDDVGAPAGRVALVAQSRMIAAAVLDWAGDIQLGFSAVVTVGESESVTVAEILEYLAMDPRTESIVLYLERVDTSRRFTSALHAAASVKPVIILKAGRLGDNNESAEDAVFDALLRRTGAVRIRFFVQLFSALKVLVHAKHSLGRRIALFSNGYGAAHLALDMVGPRAPILRADLNTKTIKELRSLLEPGAAVNNPVISHAPLTPEIMESALNIITEDNNVDGLLVLIAPDALSDMDASSEALAKFSEKSRKPVVSCFMGDASMRRHRHRLDSVGLPAFRSPESAANAFGILASYNYNQTLAQQTIPPEMLNSAPRIDEAHMLLNDALMRGKDSLDRQTCRWLLDCFHVPILVEDSPVSESITDGVPMAIHVYQDSQFGPYIQFGPGQTYAKLFSPHKEIELPPLNNYLARQLIQRGKFWNRILEKDLTSSAFEKLRESLERISEIVSELPAIKTISIDPIWSDDTDLFAGQIQIELDPSYDGERPEYTSYRHMAIHPYPRRLVQNMQAHKLGQWQLRPIRPEDAIPLQEFIRDLSDESRYMRFVSMLRELTPKMLARYTRIDYDREVALVATVQVANPENRGLLKERIVGFAHYLRNRDGQGAEYALVIADDCQRQGIGKALMRSLIDLAKEQGLSYIEGIVLANNRPMQGLMTHLGFTNDPDSEDPGMRRIWMNLT